MTEPPPPPKPLKGLSYNTGYGTGTMLLMSFGELRGESMNGSTGVLKTYAYERLRGLSFTYIGGKFAKTKKDVRSAVYNPDGASYLQVLLGDTGYMTAPFEMVTAGNRLLTAFESGRMPHPGALPLEGRPQGGKPQTLVSAQEPAPLRGLATGSAGGFTGASSSRPVLLRGVAVGGSLP
jgi:hypothetical protein